MNYYKIEKASVSNGSGVRVVLWISGCTIRCEGCHNPELQDFEAGKLFDKEAKEALFEALDNFYIKGITFSGGHPLELLNVQDVLKLIKEIREKFPNKDIWLYTGYTLDINNFTSNILDDEKVTCHFDLIQEIITRCDVIVDGPFEDSLRDITLPFRGSSNQRLIDVKKTIENNEIVLWENN